MTILSTECKKCGAVMPELARVCNMGIMGKVPMTITGYLCTAYHHWNDFTKRKWFRDARKKVKP